MKRRLKVKMQEITRQTRTTMPVGFAAFCVRCEGESEIVTKTEASIILQTGDLDLESLISSGNVHAIKAVNGAIWICKNSLFERSEDSQ